MALQIVTTMVGGNADYAPYVVGSPVKTDRVGDADLFDFQLSPFGTAFVPLHRGSYIRVLTTAFNPWFTGYVTNNPELTFLGSYHGEPKYGYVIEASSDEYLLNIKPVGIHPPFLNTTQGAILKALVAQLDDADQFDVTGIGTGMPVARYVVDPTKKFLDIAKEFTDAANYIFNCRDHALHFYQADSIAAALTIDANDKHFNPGKLIAKQTTDPVVNDCTVLGGIEPQDYINEYFLGDGFTAQFPLMSSVFGVDSTLWLDDDFSGNTIDDTKWLVYDTTSPTLQLSNGYINCLGGSNNNSYDVSLQSLSLIPLEGNLSLVHGQYDFVAPSDGVICGLWTGAVDYRFGNCFYGVRVVKSGSTSVLSPIVNGVVDNTQTVTINSANRYVLRTIISFADLFRQEGSYTWMRDGIVQSVGGSVAPTTARTIQTYVTEIDPTTAAVVTQTVFSNNGVTLSSGWATYIPLAANDLHCSMSGVTISSPMQASLSVMNPTDTVFTPRIMGPNQMDALDGLAPVATIADANNGAATASSLLGTPQYNPGTAVLQFFKDTAAQTTTVPVARAQMSLQYRHAGSAIGRVQDAAAIEREAEAWGDNGLRSAVRTDLSPAPRTSAECELAARTIVGEMSVPRFEGSYNQTYPFSFTAEPQAGTILTFGTLPPQYSRRIVTSAGGEVRMFWSGTFQHPYATVFQQFILPTMLPTDAVITGIYPSFIGSAVGTTRAIAYGNASFDRYQFNIPSGTFSTGQYYGASIGTDVSDLDGQYVTCSLFNTVFVPNRDDVINIDSVGYAIYYTSASQPNVVDPYLPPPLTLATNGCLAWARPISATTTPQDDRGFSTATFTYDIPADGYLQAETITQIKTTMISKNQPEFFDVAIDFGPTDKLRQLLTNFATQSDVFTPVDDAQIPNAINTEGVGLAFTQQPTKVTLTSWTSTDFNFTMDAAPPNPGGYEVRYTNKGWGSSDSKNLVVRTPLSTFSVPRNQRGKSVFVKAYDERNKWIYSDDFTLMSQSSLTGTLVLDHGTNRQGEYGRYSTLTGSVTITTGVDAAGAKAVFSLSYKGPVGATLTVTATGGTATPLACDGAWKRVSIPLDGSGGAISVTLDTGASAIHVGQASLEIGTNTETVYCATNGTAYGALSRYAAGIRVSYPGIPPAPTLKLKSIDAIPQWSTAATPVVGNFIGLFGEIPLTGGGSVLITGGQGAANGDAPSLPSTYSVANSLVWTTPGAGWNSTIQIDGVYQSTLSGGTFSSSFQNRSNTLGFPSTTNWMAIAWTAGAAVTQSTVGGITYLQFTTKLGDTLCFAVGNIPSGGSVSVPSGFSASNFQYIVGMASTNATSSGLQGVQTCTLDSGLTLHSLYNDNSGHTWSGSANVFGVFWNTGGGVTSASVSGGTAITIPTTTGNSVTLIAATISNGGTLGLPSGYSSATVIPTSAINGFTPSGSNVSHGWDQCQVSGLVGYFEYKDGSGHQWAGGGNVFAVAANPYSAPAPTLPQQTLLGYTYQITLDFIDPVLMNDVWGYEIRADDDTTVLYHADLTDTSYTGEVVLTTTSRSGLYYVYSYNLLGEYSTPNTISFSSPANAGVISNLRIDESTHTLLWDFASTLSPGANFTITIDTDGTFAAPTVTATSTTTSYPIPQSEFYAHRFFRVVYNDPLGPSSPLVLEHTYSALGVTEFGPNEAFPVEPPATGSSTPVPPAALPAAYDSLYDSLSLAIH